MTSAKKIDIIPAVVDVCRRQRKIIAAYLFGSQADRSATDKSDIDLAILLSVREENDFDLLDFIVEIERLVKKQVDAVVLNRAPELLKYEVRKKGRLIYEKDPQERKYFEIRSRKSFEDFLFMHRRYVKAVFNGDTHG